MYVFMYMGEYQIVVYFGYGTNSIFFLPKHLFFSVKYRKNSIKINEIYICELKLL